MTKITSIRNEGVGITTDLTDIKKQRNTMNNSRNINLKTYIKWINSLTVTNYQNITKIK